MSGTYLSVGKWSEALRHGKRCTTLKPTFAKGHSRVGTAHAYMNNHREAIIAFETVRPNPHPHPNPAARPYPSPSPSPLTPALSSSPPTPPPPHPHPHPALTTLVITG